MEQRPDIRIRYFPSRASAQRREARQSGIGVRHPELARKWPASHPALVAREVPDPEDFEGEGAEPPDALLALRDWMWEHNVKQVDLAGAAGIAPTQLNEYLRGVRALTYEAVDRITAGMHAITEWRRLVLAAARGEER